MPRDTESVVRTLEFYIVIAELRRHMIIFWTVLSVSVIEFYVIICDFMPNEQIQSEPRATHKYYQKPR